MSLFHVSIGLTVFANVLYHLFQMEISSSIHPLVSLMATYGVALAVCAAMPPFYPHETANAVSLRKLNWPALRSPLLLCGWPFGVTHGFERGESSAPGHPRPAKWPTRFLQRAQQAVRRPTIR